MSEQQSSELPTKPGGLRLVPPALPPAPPSGGQRPPGSGPPSPDPNSGGSAALGRELEACLRDLALIRVTLETLSEFPDLELDVEMRPLIEDARLLLINRLQEIDCRVVDGSGSFSDVELRGFHRAMIDVIRRGVRWSALESWGRGAGLDGVFRYSLPLRHPHEDPCANSPTALLRRILDDLIEELSAAASPASVEDFDHAVYWKFLAVLFACLVGVSPLLTEDD